MKTQTLEKVRNLPISKHFDTSALTTTANNTLDNFRKGEKGWYNILKLALFGGLGYLAWVYVLPQVFQMIGKALAIGGTIAVVVLMVALAPVYLKWVRNFARFSHKMVIKHNPFGELYSQLEKMKNQLVEYLKSKGRIKGIQQQMEDDSAQAEKNAKELLAQVKELQRESNDIKAQMDKLIAKGGEKAKTSDEYIDLNIRYLNVVSNAHRAGSRLEQEKDLVVKYGTRAAIFKNLHTKLLYIETGMKIKIEDFNTSIDILKKDYELAEKSRIATSAAKDAMDWEGKWEIDYALDVVTSTIAQDIAITSSNLRDINDLENNYSSGDVESMKRKLDQLVLNIENGDEAIKDSSEYLNPDYVLTSEDRKKSGGFDDIEF